MLRDRYVVLYCLGVLPSHNDLKKKKKGKRNRLFIVFIARTIFIISMVEFNAEGIHFSTSTTTSLSTSISISFFISKMYVRDLV